MMESNIKLRQRSIEAILRMTNTELFLPAIQRNYTWDLERVAQLFDSIMKGYPIGPLLFWKHSIEEYNCAEYDFCKFVHEARETESCGNRLIKPADSLKKKYVNIVLDGQQRITAFNIALTGDGGYRMWNRQGIQGKGEAPLWELYFSPKGRDTKEIEKKNEFQFFSSQEIIDSEKWYKVKDVFAASNIEEFFKKNNVTKKPEQAQLMKLFDKLHSAEIVDCYEIPKDFGIDDVLEIYLRMNSGGKHLKKNNIIDEFAKDISCLMGVKQARVLLIAIKLSGFRDEEKYKLAHEWEITTFRLFCLHRKDARSYVDEYIRCSIDILDLSKSADEICDDIRDIGKENTFDEGIKKVEGKPWYPEYSKDVVFILRKYDEYLTRKIGVEIDEGSWSAIWSKEPSSSIEHIFPKTYPKGKDKDFEDNWQHGGKQWSQEKLDGFVHNIGNLTLLPHDKNSSDEYKPYDKKIRNYEKNALRIHPSKDSYYLQRGYWTEQSIIQREQEILKFIRETWG